MTDLLRENESGLGCLLEFEQFDMWNYPNAPITASMYQGVRSAQAGVSKLR